MSRFFFCSADQGVQHARKLLGREEKGGEGERNREKQRETERNREEEKEEKEEKEEREEKERERGEAEGEGEGEGEREGERAQVIVRMLGNVLDGQPTVRERCLRSALSDLNLKQQGNENNILWTQWPQTHDLLSSSLKRFFFLKEKTCFIKKRSRCHAGQVPCRTSFVSVRCRGAVQHSQHLSPASFRSSLLWKS